MNDIVHEQSESSFENKQKKKSRGNRKLQRYRRKCRDQGIQQKNQPIVHSTDSVKNEKCTSLRETELPVIVNNSIDYTSISDETFSQILSTCFNRTEELNGFMTEKDQIELIRHYTSLIGRFCYIHLQDYQWKYYYHIGVTENIWKSRMTKHVAEKNSICHTYGRSKNLIEQRLKQIEQHLQQTQHAIQQYETELLSKYAHNYDCISLLRKLSSTLYQFVQEKQQSIRHEFEYKREILLLDAMDHQLVQMFFDFKPNKSHIISARRIWQTTMKQLSIEEDVALLQQRLTIVSSSRSSLKNLLDCMIDDIDTILKDNSNETEHISSDEINRLHMLRQNIIHQAIFTCNGMIENLNAIIETEKNKFSIKNRFMESTSEWQRTVWNAIEFRRLHMIKRAHFIIKYKLTTTGNIMMAIRR